MSTCEDKEINKASSHMAISSHVCFKFVKSCIEKKQFRGEYACIVKERQANGKWKMRIKIKRLDLQGCVFK